MSRWKLSMPAFLASFAQLALMGASSYRDALVSAGHARATGEHNPGACPVVTGWTLV